MAEIDTTSVLKITDSLSLRYLKAGSGPPLVLLHTIRTHSSTSASSSQS